MQWAAIKRLWPFGVGLVAILLIVGILMIYGEGKNSGAAASDLATAKTNVEVAKSDRAADSNAAEFRVKDKVRAGAEAAELKGATDDAAKRGTDPRAAYYECVSRQQHARARLDQSPTCR